MMDVTVRALWRTKNKLLDGFDQKKKSIEWRKDRETEISLKTDSGYPKEPGVNKS